MTKFNARLLGGVEATENTDNQEWWQNNPMTYDWDKALGSLFLTSDIFLR